MAVVLSTIDQVELEKLIQLVRLKEPRDDLIERLIQELESLVPLKAEQTAIIEAFDGLIYVCSENFTIEFMNRRFIERTGRYPLGEKCYSALHDLDSICPWCVNQKVQRGEKVEWEVLSPKDNRYYAIVNTPIHRPNGSISKMAMIRDITNLVRAEETLKSRTEALERSNKDLEQFAYIAAHDLREPLLAVAAYLKVLDRRYRGRLDLEADKLIAGALNATFRMDSLIQSLLAYSRIGNEDPGFQKSNSQEILGTAIANLQSMIDETGAQITHDPLPWVMVNPSQLIQLFQNLLSNAIKFAGEKAPRIHVGVTRSRDGWQYTVSDNGIGIEPPHFDRIFLLFQRIRNRPEYPGAGIGLANCRRIVEHHGGKIWVESTPGSGSTFYFTIPERQD